MRRHLGLFLLACLCTGATLLSGCVPGAPCDGEVIDVHYGYTVGEGETYSNEPCAEAITGGNYTVADVSECCPEDYTFLAIGAEGEILCQRDCKDAALSATQDALFITIEAIEAVDLAVETLYGPTSTP